MQKILHDAESLVLVVDIQERLVAALAKDKIVTHASKLVQAAHIMDIPVVFTEQYPNGLGHTVLGLISQGDDVFEKTSFSAMREEGFAQKLSEYGKKQIVLCGIETHVCVHQTCADLLDAGYEVVVVRDVCASRDSDNFKAGIDLMRQNGAKISCLETVLFEWLKDAKHPNFRSVQALIK